MCKLDSPITNKLIEKNNKDPKSNTFLKYVEKKRHVDFLWNKDTKFENLTRLSNPTIHKNDGICHYKEQLMQKSVNQYIDLEIKAFSLHEGYILSDECKNLINIITRNMSRNLGKPVVFKGLNRSYSYPKVNFTAYILWVSNDIESYIDLVPIEL